MRANTFKTRRFLTLLGIALVAGGYPVAKSYVRYEQMIRSGEQFSASVDAMAETVRLNRLQIQAEAATCVATAGGLKDLVAAHIASLNSQHTSENPAIRRFAQVVSDYVGRLRGTNSHMATNSSALSSSAESGEPRISGPIIANASVIR